MAKSEKLGPRRPIFLIGVNFRTFSMDTLNAKKVHRFFANILEAFPVNRNICSIVVTHLLPDRPFLLEAINRVAEIVSIIPKPKSIHPAVKGWLSHKYPIDQISRNEIGNPGLIKGLIKPRLKSREFIILDIGGYFSSSLPKINKALDGQLIGVIEDTENGLNKYVSSKPKKPVISVARSPLKNPEDFLVGQSIVFSTEALLREQGDILPGRTACVIGYGKLGSSIANLLATRQVRTVVFDINPVKSVQAMSHGFSVTSTLKDALKGAGIVFCATGHLALDCEDFELVEDGAYIATVTSSDDELQLDKVRKEYKINHIADYITRYKNKRHKVFLLNRGQAVNFIHGAAVGPFIYLVQAEILASISVLLSSHCQNGISENNDELRREIAKLWLDTFGPKKLGI